MGIPAARGHSRGPHCSPGQMFGDAQARTSGFPAAGMRRVGGRCGIRPFQRCPLAVPSPPSRSPRPRVTRAWRGGSREMFVLAQGCERGPRAAPGSPRIPLSSSGSSRLPLALPVPPPSTPSSPWSSSSLLLAPIPPSSPSFPSSSVSCSLWFPAASLNPTPVIPVNSGSHWLFSQFPPAIPVSPGPAASSCSSLLSQFSPGFSQLPPNPSQSSQFSPGSSQSLPVLPVPSGFSQIAPILSQSSQFPLAHPAPPSPSQFSQYPLALPSSLGSLSVLPVSPTPGPTLGCDGMG